MKTLSNAKDKAEIVQRLEAIGPASRRRWGKMTAPEMVCHLSDAFRVAMSEKTALPVSNLFTRSLMRWSALRLPIQWPHGVSTVPECEAGVRGTTPTEMERDLIELRELLEKFSKQPRKFGFAEHPILGKLSDAEWLRWGYLHTDHHLRQFGV